MNSIFVDFLKNVVVTKDTCSCHGELIQIDAQLKTDGTAVRIMESSDGFHVSIGVIPSKPPMPVKAKTAVVLLRRASNGHLPRGEVIPE